MQQNIGRAWRVNSECGTNDSAARQRRLDDVGLEILIQVLGNTHRPETDAFVHPIFAHAPKIAADLHQAANVFQPERCRVRSRTQEEISDEPTLAQGIRRVSFVGVGVMLRMSRHLAISHLRVLVGTVVVSVLHELHRPPVRSDLQTVLVQLQGAIDFRSKKTANVGAIRVNPVLV